MGLASGCSKTDAATPGAGSTKSDAGGDAGSVTVRVRPAGPSADMTEEITGAGRPFIGAATGLTAPTGYVDHEYVAAGTATAYDAGGKLSEDGLWTFTPTTTAAYRTRVLVRRPERASAFSGTVIVEWLNVSGGLDANPDYASLEEEIVRQGHVWVGVSAQLIGVEGGNVLVSVPVPDAGSLVGVGLKGIDPARYGSLTHPGDGYSFDMFTQVARALLQGGAVLGGLKPRVMIAAGESQSAFALTTYYDGVQPITQEFDGFFVHSRGSAGLPLVAPGKAADLTGSLGATPAQFRTDLDAPIIDVQAESDVTGILNSVLARQPESDKFRLWEVAGTSHADAHLLGSISSNIDCGVPINNGPMHIVAKAAFHALDAWVKTGALPPTAPRLDVQMQDGGKQGVARNADGIALGGVRTPPVDVPVDVLSGLPGTSASIICILLGSTKPLPDARLAALYASRAVYQEQYATSADAAIKAGFVLQADRDALIAFSQPSRINP